MVTSDPFGDKRLDDALAAGHAALDEGLLDEAIDLFKMALRRGANTPEREALIRCGLSEAFERCGEGRDQLEAISKYDNFPDFVRLPERTQMRVLIRLGWAHSVNNEIPRAIALFNQAIRVARRLEDEAGIGGCYFGLGRVYRVVSEIRIARDYYSSALEHFRRVGSWRELAETYFHIGNIDAREGDYRIALQSIQQALEIIGNRNDPDLLGRVYHDLAIIYDNLELPTARALESWEKCIECFRQAGNTSYLAFNYNNLASKLISLGEWDRAEAMVREAIDLLTGGPSLAQFGASLDTLAQLYLLRGRLDEASELLEESLKAFSTVKETRQPLSREYALESSTHTTIGRIFLARGRPEPAITHLKRAVEISVRLGDRQFLSDARLWLAEALLQADRVEQARSLVTEVRSDLRAAVDVLAWGLHMRIQAKLEAADGHIAAAIQSLGQSTSIFEIKGNEYDLAVNRVVLARMLNQHGHPSESISHVRSALDGFTRLGAGIDMRETAAYLDFLTQATQGSTAASRRLGEAEAAYDTRPLADTGPPGPDLVSCIDGFIGQRLVQASVSRDLLLHELAAVSRDQAASRGALVAEILRTRSESGRLSHNVRVVASVGLDQHTVAIEREFLAGLWPNNFPEHYVYGFTDGQANMLLRVVDPTALRFVARRITMEPLLRLVEQGLETDLLRSSMRRTMPQGSARMLTQAELPGFICASRAMNRVIEQIHKIRSSDVMVLITGESGTGKELIARAVHTGSSRRFNTFLPFNCSAAPRELIESQLFGHRKGAFTGAVESNRGIIRAAERGTLFLDEVGDLPIELQPKLLRFLQEGEIHPIGESQPLQVDVRVVAATNSDLERAVTEGRFREDLFHRLNVIRIQVPPLRERREEIPALVDYYLKQYQQEAAKSGIKLAQEALDLMVVYDWPGNVRQLCNEIRRIVAYSEPGSTATIEVLSPEIAQMAHQNKPDPAADAEAVEDWHESTGGGTLAEAVEELERSMMRDALHRSKGNISQAARLLGLTRKGLYLKMDRLNFET
jgi:DNA-binding NtrC family response regulator/tetratricopeptide (TPR) repeat protein